MTPPPKWYKVYMNFRENRCAGTEVTGDKHALLLFLQEDGVKVTTAGRRRRPSKSHITFFMTLRHVSHVLNSVAPRSRMNGPVTPPPLHLHGVDTEMSTLGLPRSVLGQLSILRTIHE